MDLYSWSFVDFYVQQEIEEAHLLDRLYYPDNFNQLSPNNSVGEDADYCN